MMMTEAEALEKWCPFARVGVRGSSEDASDRDWLGTSFNRAILLDNDEDNREYQSDLPKCIGSACMAWRWTHTGAASFLVAFDDKPEEEWAWNPTERYADEPGRVKSVRPVPKSGFCGLAGKPI